MSEQIWQRALENFQAQRFSEAINDCQQLIHADPVWPMAYPLLSSIHLHLGQVKLATFYAVAATQHLENLDWDGVLRISTALLQVGENRLSHSILSGIENRNFLPELAAAHLGRQYYTLEDIPKALSFFEQAIDSGDHSAASYSALGLTLAVVGEFKRSASAYENSYSQSDYLAHMDWARSQLPILDGIEERIARMKAALEKPDAPVLVSVSLAYALFKEYDRLGDTEQAWQYLQQGAQARRLASVYDPLNERQIFKQLLDFFENHQEVSSSLPLPFQKTPVFIVGMPRSGTTLLERILGNHPDIKPCGELTVLHQQLQWVTDTVMPIALDLRIGNILKNANFEELGQRYLQKTDWLVEKHRFFSDKQPMNFFHCGAILSAIPNARIINMRRNPIDSCFSNLKELFAPGYYPYSYQLDECAAHYRNYTELMRGWHRLFPGKILDVKYEHLVMQPEIETQRVFEYLGLDFTSDMLDIGKNKNITTTASSMQVREPIHMNNIDGWRRYEKYFHEWEIDLQAEIADYSLK